MTYQAKIAATPIPPSGTENALALNSERRDLTMSTKLKARVQALRFEAERVISIELHPVGNRTSFPSFTAGAHVDLGLPNGLTRSYSLCNDADGASHYAVAVLNEPHSRGGSKFIHEQLRVGTVLDISAPRNNFALDETAERSVLIAGGIGVTPILAMIRRLKRIGRDFELVYCARSRAEAPFLREIAEIAGARVAFHFDDEAGGPPVMEALLAGKDAAAHFYCCGPAPMLAAFDAASNKLGFAHCHVERFAAARQGEQAVSDGGFTLELARSGRTIEVPPGLSILQAVREAGLVAESSCEEGICGACETRVLSGDVDHRDSILSDREREANNTMMICVSRCRGRLLRLDL